MPYILGSGSSDPANVKTYGVTGDGVTDDTAAIQYAIATIGSGPVYFPAGTYVTTGIVIQNKSSFSLIGARGSKIVMAANTTGAPNQGSANLITLADCTDFTIENLTLDGRRDTLFPLTPLAANAANGQATVQVANGAAAAYTVGQRLNVCGGLTVSGGAEANQQNQQMVIASITPGTSGANDVITFSTNLTSAYTASSGTFSDGYGAYAAPGAYITPWQTGQATVAGRALTEEDQQNGIHLLNCTRFEITGCSIHNVWESPIRLGTHNLAGGAQADGCSYATISENFLWHGYDQGVGLWCSSKITVSGNVITAAGWAGVSMTLSDDCTVTANTATDNVQRIPNDTKSGYGVAIEGGSRNTVGGNILRNNFGSQLYLTAGGTLPFGGPAQVAASVAAGSDTVPLPSATINLNSTTGLATAGQITVMTSAGAQQVTYTGITGSQLTGCSGGIGTMYSGNRVTQYPVFINNSGTALTIGSASVTVTDGTKFQANGRYTIVDGPRSEKIVVQSIATNVLTLTAPTRFQHPDQCQIGQSVCEDNELIGNILSGGTDAGIKLASALRTTIAKNTITGVGLRGIDLQIWASGGLQPPYGTIINGNNIIAPDTSGDGAAYSAIAAYSVSDLDITGNRLSGAAAANVSYTTLYLGGVTDSAISGNTIADSYGVGLRLDSVNEWTCKRVQVIGNKILRCFGEGLLLWGGDALTVKNNVITGCASNGGPGGFGGALNVRGVKNSQISDNAVVNNGHNGIGLDNATIQGATVTCSGNTFAGNTVRDDGMNYDAFTGAATQQGSGIKELGGTQGPNTFLNNLVSGNITNWGISSTGNVLRGNQNYNPVGKVSAQPTLPATGVNYTNTLNVDCTVFISGGTVTAVNVGGQATGLSSPATVRVPAGQTISVAYSVAPTWIWFGD